MSSYSFQGRKRFWTPRDEEENRAIFSTCRQETGIKMPNKFTPVYFAHAENEVEKWSLKRLIRLLRMYGAHRCLWDIRDPDNRNRKLRKAALIDITAAMGEGVTRAHVVQKINVLRATYRYEKRRIKQRMRKGIGAKTKLKWFALADAFLRHVPRAEQSRRNEKKTDSDSDLEDAVVFTIDPETLIPLDEDEAETETESAINQCGNDYAVERSIEEEHINVSAVCHSPLLNEESFRENTGAPINEVASPVVIKKEVIDLNVSSVNNPKPQFVVKEHDWTSHDSLLFVQLLQEHPVLWGSAWKYVGAQEQRAILQIANVMQLSTRRVAKRVQTFRRCCKNELAKIAQDRAYKPNIVWWPVAESFMAHSAMTADLFFTETEHFVDANEVPPATPINTSTNHIKSEITHADELCNPGTPINPIPSVCTNMLTVDEELDALFHKESESIIEMENYCDSSEVTSTPTVTTKLIWHGLEDDLLEGKWSLKHSVKFLRLYGAHRCLWDLNDPEYRSRELRHAAIEDIAAAMGYGLDAEYVAKKIKIFRITYMQHRKRMLEAIKQGKQPEIQLRWFPLADSFLRPHIGLRSIKNKECEMPQFDFQYVYANLNLIDPALLTDFRGKGTQNTIEIGGEIEREHHTNKEQEENLQLETVELVNIKQEQF